MSLSHRQLRRWYLDLNRRWFRSALPEDMDVYYAPDDKAHGMAIREVTGERSIKIDTAIAGSRHAKLTLIHEMVHHFTGDFTHGEKFQKCMIALANEGAFRKIW